MDKLRCVNGALRFSATIFAEPCRKNPADLHRFAKIENLGVLPGGFAFSTALTIESLGSFSTIEISQFCAQT